jgi:hypothetical protein
MNWKTKRNTPAAISWSAVLISLGLHILVLAPMVGAFGTSTESRTGHNDSGEMILTFINEVDSDANVQAAGFISDGSALFIPHVRAIGTTPIPQPNTNIPAADSVAPDFQRPDPGQQTLNNRYIQQIRARIERAWMRPRARPLDASMFRCRVLLTQDRRGNVKEVELVSCNGGTRWQTSLVHAIQSASPLPAPPEPDLYADHLLLDMSSNAYSAGGSTEGFEPRSNNNL